jgi:hypothetical protein
MSWDVELQQKSKKTIHDLDKYAAYHCLNPLKSVEF